MDDPRPAPAPPALAGTPVGGGEREAFLRTMFPGESEMAQRMRAFDWAASDFGPVEHWPEHLRIAVRLCLTSRFPFLVWWGPRLALLYNDAYLPWLTAAKHPRALGRPGYESWSEIWDTIGPMLDGVLSTGQATWSVDAELFYDRKVRQEEVYITWSFTPILGADGRTVNGIFNPCIETTEQVIGARRLETLRKLGIRAGDGRAVEAACQDAAAVLRDNLRDIPFAALYVTNETGDAAHLCATMGPEGDHLLPVSVSAADDRARSPWPLAAVLQTKRAATCADLDARGVRLPGGPWPEPTRQALVLPIHAAQDHLAGLLVVGVSPRRPLDAAYRTFFDLVAGYVATAISDARAYEVERQRAEALAELDRAKTAFFSNVSHEFRTPLTLMLGPIEEMLARANGSFTGSREELDLVHRNTLRLLKLVNTLLDFSRIEAGRIEAVYEPTDLAASTAELASVFRSAIEKAGLTLRVDCPALPAPVYVDREMWEKIVLNLLSNASKFTFAGDITVRLRWGGARVVLTVADTGVGIPATELPHIFERFHCVRDTRSRTHEGTGIGLSLVQELVRLHGGDITVESEQDRGTTFCVFIPTGVGHLPQERIGAERTMASTALGATLFVEEALRWMPDAAVRSPSAVAPPAPPTTGDEPRTPGTARILVADDNADMRQYVQRLLADRYTVTAVADGIAALDAAQGAPPDVIVADVMMPHLDGFGLLRAVRNDTRLAGVPVVLLSARAGEEATVEGMQAGADDYLIKPFSTAELLARIEAQVRRRRAEETLRQSEERFRRTFELGLIGMAITSPTTGILEVNDELCTIVGYERGELVRMSWVEMTYPDDLAADVAQFNRVMAGEMDGYVLDKRWIRKDGQVIDSTISVKCLRRADGAVEYFVALLQDVTERRRAEAALRRAHEELEHRVRERTRQLSTINDELMKEIAERQRAEAALHQAQADLAHVSRVLTLGAMMTSIAHELNQPLAAIMNDAHGGLLWLGQTPPHLEAAQAALQAIVRNTQQAGDIIARARTTVRKAPPHMAPLELHHVIAEVLAMTRHEVQRQQVQLHTDVAADLPRVRGDRVQVTQVLLNLVLNALEALRPVQDRPRAIRIRGTRTGASRVGVAVQDTGIGVDPPLLERLFEPLVTTKPTGLGLGLAISRTIIEAHGGHLWAARNPDYGLTVQFSLPTAGEDADA